MSKRRQFPECPSVLISVHTCTDECANVIIKICDSEDMSIEATEAFIQHLQKVIEAAKKIEKEEL